MKTATTNAAQSRVRAAAGPPPPPPPPAKRGIISGAFLAAVAALALVAASPAEAQRILSVSASVAGGASCTTCTANEGDSVVITVGFAGGLPAGGIRVNTRQTNYGGTATNGQDYTGDTVGGMVVLPASVLGSGLSDGVIRQPPPTRTYTLTITDDSETENAETITLAVPTFTQSAFGNLQRSGTNLTITIAASDGQEFSISADAATIAEDGGNVTFTVTMVGETPASAVTVDWAVSGAGIDTADYTLSGTDTDGTLSFAAPGAQTLVFAITDDTASEADETLTLTLSNPSGGATLGTATASTTITDNDAVRTLTVTGPAGGTIAEGAAGTFNIALARTAFTNPTEVTWTVTHAQTGGTSDADFAAVTGSVMFPTQTSFTITPADDNLDEDAESFTVQLSVADESADGGTAFGAAASVSIADNDTVTVTLTGPARLGEGEMGTYTVNLGAIPMAAVTVTYSITGEGSAGVTTDPASPLTITPPATTATLTLTTDDGGGRGTPDRSFTITITDVSGGATPPERPTLTITITEDDPAAREARLEAPLASAGRGVGQLAAEAIQQRLAHGAGGGNSLTLAGRNIAGAEVLAAEYLAGGYATSAADLLRSSGFNLAAGDGERGLSFWGGGAHVSAKGKHDGVDYDGDTSAFTLGIDAGWRDGLVGVAVARSDGDADFTVIADGMESTLETAVTSAHPYLTRRFGKSQLWLTAGYGSGDAELIEPDATIKTDITVTTAALGLTRAEDAQLSGGISALYTRAELDAATGGGRTLNATTAASLRVAASAQARWTHGAWSPFLDFALRHDSGDGDTGIAGDVGGGIEYRAPTVQIRLAVSASASAESAEESRASFTVRKSSGDFAFGLNLGADGDGVDTGRLLTGEWRF